MPINPVNPRIDKVIDRCQFYQALVDSLSSRLMPESERGLMDCLNVLFPSLWPSDISAEYGEVELRQACSKFRISYSGDLKQDYRDLKDAKDNNFVGLNLKKLTGAINTLPVSTAECERGFSQMNLICTPTRSTISVKHMSSLMLISITGPPLGKWCPMTYVQTWLAKGHHAATDSGKTRAQYDENKISAGRKAIWKALQ